MRYKFLFSILIAQMLFFVFSCNQNKQAIKKTGNNNSFYTERQLTKIKETEEQVYKLPGPEFEEYKKTMLVDLRKHVLEKRELGNGFAYRFSGSDDSIDELILFLKTERECCSFLTFNLSVSGDKSEAWLELTGPANIKEFITTELGL